MIFIADGQGGCQQRHGDLVDLWILVQPRSQHGSFGLRLLCSFCFLDFHSWCCLTHLLGTWYSPNSASKFKSQSSRACFPVCKRWAAHPDRAWPEKQILTPRNGKIAGSLVVMNVPLPSYGSCGTFTGLAIVHHLGKFAKNPRSNWQ